MYFYKTSNIQLKTAQHVMKKNNKWLRWFLNVFLNSGHVTFSIYIVVLASRFLFFPLQFLFYPPIDNYYVIIAS